MTPEHDAIYRLNGYASREAYLDCMAEDYDLPREFVQLLADLLGPNEDFDGLVVALEDAECGL